MNRINKSDLVDRVRNLPFSPSVATAQLIVDTILDAIREEVAAGRTVALRGFGTFSLRKRAGRIGRNPRTGEAIEIAASEGMVFKPGKQEAS